MFGRTVLTDTHFPGKSLGRLRICSRGGPVKLLGGEAHWLDAVWR